MTLRHKYGALRQTDMTLRHISIEKIMTLHHKYDAKSYENMTQSHIYDAKS